jgi:hypothetical protein
MLEEEEGDIDAPNMSLSTRNVGDLSKPPTARDIDLHHKDDEEPHVGCSGQSKVSQQDFILFENKNLARNKENQRLLGSFGIENLSMFFIKYRVDRNSINDPFYQQLIHQCYNFLVMYCKDNIQN